MRDYNLVRRKKKETCLMNFPLTMRDVFFSTGKSKRRERKGEETTRVNEREKQEINENSLRWNISNLQKDKVLHRNLLK